MNITDFNEEYINTLISLGFQEYDSNNDEHWNPELEIEEDSILFIEEQMCRQRIYVLLYNSEQDDWFNVYVLNNIGCGVVLMPFLWSDINANWLTHLKKSFYLHGFLKDKKEVITTAL